MPMSPKSVPVDCQHCHLRRSGMFCNLSAPALADFNLLGSLLTIPTGAVLFREEDPADHVAILCSGHIKLSCVSVNGRTMNLKIASPGDVLGLHAILSNSVFEVSAEALEPVTVNIIRRMDFLNLLERHGEAAIYAAKALSAEYKTAFSDARRLALSGSVSGRLANLLLGWASAPTSIKPGMQFSMVLTHDDLADFIATSRETVTRTLGKFQQDKLISIHGSSIHILQPEQLAALAA